MAKSNEFTVISISMDGVWAGSGKLVDGQIKDCSAQFCDDNDESLEVYELIEDAIESGKDSIKVEFSDDTTRRIDWTIVEPS